MVLNYSPNQSQEQIIDRVFSWMCFLIFEAWKEFRKVRQIQYSKVKPKRRKFIGKGTLQGKYNIQNSLDIVSLKQTHQDVLPTFNFKQANRKLLQSMLLGKLQGHAIN